MKVKILRKQLKTVAKYIYRPEFHGDWTDLLVALEEIFELSDNPLPKRRPMRIKRKQIVPPPIPLEARRSEEPLLRPYGRYMVTVHRATPTMRTLCGSNAYDVVTTLEDPLVTCSNCLLPKHQAKLREQEPQENHDEVGDKHPTKHLPKVPHFILQSSGNSLSV